MKPMTVLMTVIIVIALSCALGSALTEQWPIRLTVKYFRC